MWLKLKMGALFKCSIRHKIGLVDKNMGSNARGQ